MSDWTEGYVADIDYTFGYYGELNPNRVTLPFLNIGLAPPEITTACELGFGQGISVTIHSAASAVRWWGTDFNPAHASLAQRLAAASGSGTQLFDQSFAEFCARPDLPEFDYVGVHGVWSWISDENERVIIDFLRRKLKVGGVVYISYNTHPGFAAMVPFRQLLMQYMEVMAPSGRGIVSRIDAALEFADKFLAQTTIFSATNPTFAQRIAAIKGFNRNYVAHEYFNRDWRAMQFGEMAQRLSQAKLSYACSANYLDHVEGLNLTADQQRFLAELPDPMLRQSVRDFVINQQFRRDYWVKGPRRRTSLEQAEALRQVRLMLVMPRDEATLTVTGGVLGQREMAPNIYPPILDALAARDVMSFGELERELGGAGLRLGTIYEAVMVLVGKGDVVVVQDDVVQAQARPHSERLNRYLLDKARGGGDLTYLASPVTGGGIGVARFHQLFLLARRQGLEDADNLARYVWEVIGPQGQRVVKDGKTLESATDNVAELATQARDFLDKRLAVYRKLQLA